MQSGTLASSSRTAKWILVICQSADAWLSPPHSYITSQYNAGWPACIRTGIPHETSHCCFRRSYIQIHTLTVVQRAAKHNFIKRDNHKHHHIAYTNSHFQLVQYLLSYMFRPQDRAIFREILCKQVGSESLCILDITMDVTRSGMGHGLD
jgi:hypothetical protein